MDSPHAIIYLVRHGETDWNKQDLLQGQTDIPLNETGKAQAEETRDLLKEIHFDTVFSSDLSRAKQTAEILALERELAVNTSTLLRERSYGIYEGRPHDEYRAARKEILDKLPQLAAAEQVNIPIADAEMNERAISRVITFLREIAVTHQGKTVLVVSHGGIMGALLVHLGWVNPWMVKVHNAAFVELHSDGVEFEVKRVHNIEKLTSTYFYG
jgi:broad specificity phosphatase PhoE